MAEYGAAALLPPGAPRSTEEGKEALRRSVQKVRWTAAKAKEHDDAARAQHATILPRGTIPLYDERVFDDAMKHGAGDEHAERVAMPRFSDAHKSGMNLDPDRAEAFARQKRLLMRYRALLRGAKPHGGASVTALAIARTVESQGGPSLDVDTQAFADSLVSGGVDSSIAVHDMSTGALIVQRANAHGVSSVLCVAVLSCGHAAGQQVISGGHDGTLRCWRLNDLHPLGEPQETVHDGWPIMCVAACPHDDARGVGSRGDARDAPAAQQRFITSGQDMGLILWLAAEAPSGLTLTPQLQCRIGNTVGEPPFHLTALAWLPGGESVSGGVGVRWTDGRCFAGDAYGRIVAWSLDDMRRAAHAAEQLEAGAAATPPSADGAADGGAAAAAAAASADLRVRTVRATSADGTAPVRIGATVRGLASSPDGELVSCDEYGFIISWGVVARPERLRPDGAAEPPHAPDDLQLDDERVNVLFELRKHAEVRHAHGMIEHNEGARRARPHAVYAVACAPDGALLVSGGDDGVIRRWCYGPGAREVVTMLNAARGYAGVEETRALGGASPWPLLLRSSSSPPSSPRTTPRGRLSRVRPLGASDRMPGWISWGQDSSLLSEEGAVNVVVCWYNAQQPHTRYRGSLFTAGTDGRLRQWHFDDSARRPILTHVATLAVPMYDNDGSRPGLPPGLPPSTRRAESARARAVEHGAAAPRAHKRVVAVVCAAFSPDGSTLFCGNLDGSLYAYDVRPTADRLALDALPTVLHMNAHGESAESGRPLPIVAMVVLPPGWGGHPTPLLVTSAEGRSSRRGAGGSLCAWDVARRERLRVHALPYPGALFALAYVGRPPPPAWGDGGRSAAALVAAGPSPSSISLWRATLEPLKRGHDFGAADTGRVSGGGQLQLQLKLHCLRRNAHAGSKVKCVTASADGRLVLSGGADGHAHVWAVDLANLELELIGLAVHSAHSKLAVHALVLAPPPSEHVLSAGADGALRVWPRSWCTRADASIQRFEPALVYARSERAEGADGARSLSGDDEGDVGSDDEDSGASAAEPGAPRMQAEMLFLGAAEVPTGGAGLRATRLPRVSPAALALVELTGGGGGVGGGAGATSRELTDDATSGRASGGAHGLGAAGDEDGLTESAPLSVLPTPHAVSRGGAARWAASEGAGGVWASLALLWPARLAANTNTLVLHAVRSRNHAVLHRLLCLSAACDWGDPYALFESAQRPHFTALRLAVRQADRRSIRLLLAYAVQLKRKAHRLSAVLHVEDALLLLERYPYILAGFLADLGLERVHRDVSVPQAYEGSLRWVHRSARSVWGALDALLDALGWPLCVPRGGFLTAVASTSDPPGLWDRVRVESAADQMQTTPVRALRVGVRDALACRELLPLLFASRARDQLLRTPVVIALIDAKWHAYGCASWVGEYALVCVYCCAYLSFLLLSVFRDEEVVAFGGRTLQLRHVQDTATFCAKLVTGVNCIFLMRELCLWRMATRTTGSPLPYWHEPSSFFNWALVLSTSAATTLYLQCNGESSRAAHAATADFCVGGHHPKTSSAAALGMVMLGFRALAVLRVLPQMAEVVNMVIRVVYELYHFVLVMLLVIFSFGLALFVRLSDRSRQWWEAPGAMRPCEWQATSDGSAPAECAVSDDFSSFVRVFLSAWGMLLGEVQVDNFDSDAVDMILFFLFTFLLSVLLLNLIIAVIAEYHRRVMERGEYAWREALASTVASTDLLQLWWCTERRLAAGAGASTRAPRWRRLPIDQGEDEADDADERGAWAPVEVEPHISRAGAALLACSALLGGAAGSAFGASLARLVGARSTGVATAMPVAFAAAAAVQAAGKGLLAEPQRAKQLAARASGRLSAWWALEGAPVACDVAIVVAAAGGLLGAFAGFDAAQWMPQLAPRAPRPCECFATDTALGATFSALVGAIVVGTRLRARRAFSILTDAMALALVLAIGSGIGAFSGFFSADLLLSVEGEREFMVDGAMIGAHLAAAGYAAAAAGGWGGLGVALCACCAWWLRALPGTRWRTIGVSGAHPVTALAAPAGAVALVALLHAADAAGRFVLAQYAVNRQLTAAAKRAAASRLEPARARALVSHAALAAAGAACGLAAARVGELSGYLAGLNEMLGSLLSASAVALLLVLLRLCDWLCGTSCALGGAADGQRDEAQRELKWAFVLEDVYSTKLSSSRPAPAALALAR